MNKEKIIRGFVKGLAGVILTGSLRLATLTINDFTNDYINTKSDYENEKANVEDVSRDILILAGNGETAFGKQEISELYNNIKDSISNKDNINVELVGNGEDKINLKEMKKSLVQ